MCILMFVLVLTLIIAVVGFCIMPELTRSPFRVRRGERRGEERRERRGGRGEIITREASTGIVTREVSRIQQASSLLPLPASSKAAKNPNERCNTRTRCEDAKREDKSRHDEPQPSSSFSFLYPRPLCLALSTSPSPPCRPHAPSSRVLPCSTPLSFTPWTSALLSPPLPLPLQLRARRSGSG